MVIINADSRFATLTAIGRILQRQHGNVCCPTGAEMEWPTNELMLSGPGRQLVTFGFRG